MKLIITIDPSIAVTYGLRDCASFLTHMNLATENAIKKQNDDGSVFGKLLFNRPGAIKVEAE